MFIKLMWLGDDYDGDTWQHGFARNVDWSILDSESVEGNPGVTLELKDDAYSRSMWDFSFQATYKVSCYLLYQKHKRHFNL